jgi:outer membrane protein assembly factor BamB
VPDRHPVCPVPVANVARIGVLAFLILGIGCANRGAGDRQQRLPADLPRPKLLWSVSVLSGSLGTELPLDPSGTVFLDRDRHVPIAVSAKIGSRLWTAEVDPAMPVASSPYSARYFHLSLADKVLVLGTEGYLGAYSTDDGRRLWSRPEQACNLLETRSNHLRLSCPKNGHFTDRIVKAATGEEVAVVESAPVDNRTTKPRSVLDDWRDVTLGRDVVLVAWDNGTKMEGRPLRAGPPSWRVDLPPDPSVDSRSGVPMLLVDGVIIWFGGPIIALDESTGRRLWERPLSNGHRATVAGNVLWLMERAGIVKLDARSGAVSGLYPVPSLPHRGAAYELLASGDRVALVEANVRTAETEEGYVFTWTAGAPVPVILRRPARTDVFAMVGDVLLAAAADDAQLVAADLGGGEPPLASLSPQAAVAAVMSDPNERARNGQLERIPGLGPYLVERLRNPDDPIAASALRYLAKHPVPEALPVLLDRLQRSSADENRRLVLRALAAQDDLRASHALGPFAKDEPAAREQLWRTGRTSALALCSAQAPRSLAVSGASDGAAIGTAHPLLFQEVSPDGRWVVVCQARQDSNGDGKIELSLGQHGDLVGDQARPYLVLGSGPGYAVGDVLARDAGGRYVAVREGACLSLVDTRAKTITTLPDADLREADNVFGPSRAASFDARGTRMVYQRGGVPRPRVVVRNLGDGRELAIDPGAGDLFRASLDAEGAWVLLEFVEGGSWPKAITSLAPRTCRGRPGSFSVSGRTEGTIVKRVAPAIGGAPREIPGLLRPFGADLLVREPNDELAVVDPSSGRKRRTLVPASCHGQLLHADGQRGLALVACRGLENEPGASIELHDGTTPVTFGQGPPAHGDHWEPGRPRYILVGDRLLDLDRRRLVDSADVGPNEARTTDSDDLLKKGVHAIRGDGAQLRSPTVPAGTGRRELPLGPLRWEEARRAHSR